MSTATKLIDLLKNDFKSRRRKETVLGVEVWVTPMSAADQTRVNAAHPDDGGLRMAEILVMKCRTADGHPIFTKDDKLDLKEAVAADRLGPVLEAINGAGVEEQAKN